MVDAPLDSFVKKRFNQNRGNYGDYKRKENGAGVTDLRSVLAKKQSTTNVTDLRAKLKPKALYTSKLASRAKQQMPPQQQQQLAHSNGKDPSRKPLKLTPSFKSSISSAVSGSSGSSSKSPRGSHSSGSEHHRRSRSSSSYKLPSYEEAKKISVTVPGLSRPVSEVRNGCYSVCMSFSLASLFFPFFFLAGLS